MAAAYKSWPLNKVTDAAHWDAKDLFSRLCIVGDAAFLSSGFLPCDVPETTPCWPPRGADAAVLCISRLGRRRGGCGHGKITVDVGRLCIVGDVAFPPLAPVMRHAGDDALVCIQPLLGAAVGLPRGRGRAVLCISRRGRRRGGCGRGKITVNAYVDSNERHLNARRERLRWRLSRPSLVRHGRRGSRADDVVVLHVADDVATVECASKELRCLVADHDAMLWKARYESIKSLNSHRQQRVEYRPPPIFSNKEPPYFTDEDMPLMSWKERYAMARWQTMVMSSWRFKTTPMPTWKPWVPSAKRAKLQTIIDMVRRRCGQHISPQHHDYRPEQLRTVVRTSSDHGWRGTTVDDSKPYRKGTVLVRCTHRLPGTMESPVTTVWSPVFF
ncbi:hypothetical protein BDA96_10G132800 [Sorghum bicolor]|uniref:Uncharacterized protein n=1 Tax=Sorghum bicolor TaxID=4558 RepID=A0A921Q3Z3_SORBI|nr:hypothetical protein BDA96_10G132800 [Sorghum bicolor]